MNNRNIRDWLEGIGIIAVVASLIFVGLQVRQERKIAIVETFSNRTEFTLELANLISANREVWTAGLAGKELSPEDFAVFGAIAQSVESYYMYRFARDYQIGTGSPDVDAQKFAYVLYLYPGLREIWVAKDERIKARKKIFNQPFSDVWLDAVTIQLEKLDSLRTSASPVKDHSIF
jgi:hypothetical protein